MKIKYNSGLARRDFLRWTGFAGASLMKPSLSAATRDKDYSVTLSAPLRSLPPGKADYTLRIGTGLVELAPDQIISTTTYNGQFPGSLLRFKEGQSVTVDVFNDTDTPEQLHWHGQFLPVDIDGAAEERTPFIPAHGMRRLHFTPRPAGFRFYHTHLTAGANLHRGQYTGQVGPVYIEPKHEPGSFDH